MKCKMYKFFVQLIILIQSSKSIFKFMSIQKHFNLQPFHKQSNQSAILQYRVRNLSRNQSMKQLNISNPTKKDVLSRINNKYTFETSFFCKQNINSLQVQTEQDLPKYSILKKQNQRSMKRNSSHRILRKVTSHEIIPENRQTFINPSSIKDIFQNNQKRKVTLKKKVQFIRKKHIEDKSKFFTSQTAEIQNCLSSPPQSSEQIASNGYLPLKIQTQHVLGEKKKSKSKLKILVKDPFQPKTQERKKNQLFLESKIQPNQNQSCISQANRKQFQQFLSCLN